MVSLADNLVNEAFMFMKNNMIIENDGVKDFHSCPACKISFVAGNQASNDDLTPIFYSSKHAFDEGWRKTTHHRFSENGRPVWVCPECWPGDAR